MRFGRIVFTGLLLTLLALPTLAANEGTRLLHYADIHNDKIAFVYAGDIWIVPTEGGMARRLTSSPGLELFPRFSPDGKWIAFTGDYSGAREVEVISVDGGEPRQLTFYNDIGPLPPRGGVDDEVLGWTPDGKSVVFAAHRLPWGERMTRPYVVPFAGGMETPLEIPQGFGGEFSPDGTKFVYTPIAREFRTWKRYKGGRAQDVWIYDFVHHTSEKITDWVGTDNQPMWVGNTIYFTSDRTGTLNLWAYDLTTKQTRQATFHDNWDVLWPHAGPGGIVYEAGGWIWHYDPATGKDAKVPITVSGDFKGRVPYFQNVRDNILSASISPTGVRALFGARGDVFSVPAKHGEIENLTLTPGAREIYPVWSPDGKWIAYLSDATGEYEIYLRPAGSTGAARQLTTNGSTWRFQPAWSPDSTKLAFGDKHAELRWIDVATGKITDVDKGKWNDLRDYVWSPDSRWLAYSKVGDSQLSNIWVYSLTTGKTAQLTTDDTNDYNPAFDPEGRYLYFLSDRDFNLTFSAFEFDFVYTDATRVYAGILAKDGPALFPPRSDEEKPVEETADKTTDKAKKKNGAKAEASGPKPVEIDAAGFASRVVALPVKAGNYRSLGAVKKGPLYMEGQRGETKLKMYDVAERKEETILSGIANYDLSANGEKLLFRQGTNYGIASVAPNQKTSDGQLDLEHLEMRIDPPAEWKEEFVDAWRTFRDWFYDPNMHGLDWKAMRAKYEPLVGYMAHRTDLDYILGELGGELCSGHVYIQSSKDWTPDEIQSGLLGADIVADPSGYFKVAKIFAGENWHESTRSPLTEPGVNVHEGDLILAVDGISTKGVDNFYRLLENKANRVVTLLVSSKPDGSGAHEEKVKTIQSELDLRYVDWVESRKAYVEKKSGGRIGYIYVPNTAVAGTRELFKGFYAEARSKEALIIDDRYNGGGFIPDRMIALLQRPILSYWARREIGPFMTPGFANNGPKAMLINGYASSGGDALPYYFRKEKLGTIIGTRTWGGLIGLSGNPGLMDGGAALVPTFRIFDTSGMWVVENKGVSPDIEVVDRPELEAKGIDPSLDKAIEVLMQELEKNPPNTPAPPKPPDNSKH